MPNGKRGMTFGSVFDDFRYIWSGDDAQLEKLVNRLCEPYGPEIVEGHEHYEINMETGEYIKYAEFVLS